MKVAKIYKYCKCARCKKIFRVDKWTAKWIKDLPKGTKCRGLLCKKCSDFIDEWF